eukprot:324737-Chlamydomonas_euryale.AAC.2
MFGLAVTLHHSAPSPQPPQFKVTRRFSLAAGPASRASAYSGFRAATDVFANASRRRPRLRPVRPT